MHRQRLAIAVAAAAAIQQIGHLSQLVKQFEAVLFEANGIALLIFQRQAGTTPFQHHLVLVAAVAGNLLVTQHRRGAQQAPDQEQIEEADLVGIDAERGEGVNVYGTQLDVFDAALIQRIRGLLAAARGALGADRGVELVLQLQHVVVELTILPIHLDPDLGKVRIVGVAGAAQAGQELRLAEV